MKQYSCITVNVPRSHQKSTSRMRPVTVLVIPTGVVQPFECIISYPEQFSVFRRLASLSSSLPRRSFVADIFYMRELRLASHSVFRSYSVIAALRYNRRRYISGVVVTSRISVFFHLCQRNCHVLSLQ